jgi:hypothetical protein
MNDDDIRAVLRSEPPQTQPLDPAKAIAGAHHRRRVRGVTAGLVASTAVVAVVAVGVVSSAGGSSQPPVAPPVSTTPTTELATKSVYAFQNDEPPVGTLPRDGETKIANHLYFATRGTQWAVISRVPGEPEFEPFGWRKTAGNDNIGDGRSPSMQTMGLVFSSVFRSDKARTVVYVQGRKAWYGKVYQLAGIPGWVQTSVELTGGKAPEVTPGPKQNGVSMFVYDQDGKLLVQYPGGAPDPLHS